MDEAMNHPIAGSDNEAKKDKLITLMNRMLDEKNAEIQALKGRIAELEKFVGKL